MDENDVKDAVIAELDRHVGSMSDGEYETTLILIMEELQTRVEALNS